MTDRELLELAAKAAGLEFDPTYKNAHGLKVVRDGAVCQSDQILWNPIIDDNDALRLAVRLGIAPIQDKNNKVCAAYWTDVHCCHSAYKDDPYAATRRAIVRAAAEIGKGLE